MKDYIEVEEFNDHYIHQNTKTKSFVVFAEIRDGYIIDLTFSKKRKVLYKTTSLIGMRKKIEKSGIRRSPRRH